jgi:hypothetical protein
VSNWSRLDEELRTADARKGSSVASFASSAPDAAAPADFLPDSAFFFFFSCGEDLDWGKVLRICNNSAYYCGLWVK